MKFKDLDAQIRTYETAMPQGAAAKQRTDAQDVADTLAAFLGTMPTDDELAEMDDDDADLIASCAACLEALRAHGYEADTEPPTNADREGGHGNEGADEGRDENEDAGAATDDGADESMDEDGQKEGPIPGDSPCADTYAYVLYHSISGGVVAEDHGFPTKDAAAKAATKAKSWFDAADMDLIDEVRQTASPAGKSTGEPYIRIHNITWEDGHPAPAASAPLPTEISIPISDLLQPGEATLNQNMLTYRIRAYLGHRFHAAPARFFRVSIGTMPLMDDAEAERTEIPSFDYWCRNVMDISLRNAFTTNLVHAYWDWRETLRKEADDASSKR